MAAPVVTSTMVQITQPFPDTLAFVPASPGTRDWVRSAIFGVWVCGFAVIALIRLRGWLRIRAAVRASTPIEIPAPVEVRSSPGLLEPGVVGLWRPILLLPAGITERLTPPQLQAVLAHELCHIRRRDNLTAAIHMIVEAVFWFSPLVWWISARLVDERERACDEEVLRLGSKPHDYVEAILNICKLYVESPLVCVAGVAGANLKKRIESIMANRVVGRLNVPRKLVLTTAGVVALAAPVLVGVMNARAMQAQSSRAVFEVASIKSCSPDATRGSSEERSPAGLKWNCVAVKDLIREAYILFPNGKRHLSPESAMKFILQPIEGGPAWADSAQYTITAKAKGTASMEMMYGPHASIAFRREI